MTAPTPSAHSDHIPACRRSPRAVKYSSPTSRYVTDPTLRCSAKAHPLPPIDDGFEAGMPGICLTHAARGMLGGRLRRVKAPAAGLAEGRLLRHGCETRDQRWGRIRAI